MSTFLLPVCGTAAAWLFIEAAISVHDAGNACNNRYIYTNRYKTGRYEDSYCQHTVGTSHAGYGMIER